MTNPVLGKGLNYPIEFKYGKLDVAEDIYSVRAAIYYLLTSRKGFRFFRPEFGCDLNKIIFEPCTIETAQIGSIYIREAVEEWIDRIERVKVDFTLEPENSKINFLVNFWLIGSAIPELYIYPYYLNAESWKLQNENIVNF